MAKPVANVDIISDSFENWLLITNQLTHALSTEIITANTTYANTGNNTISRTAQLWGTFGSNTLVATNELRGGNATGGYAVLTITSNTVMANASVLTINSRIGNSTINAVSNSSSILISNSVHSTTVTEGKILVGNSTVNALANSTLFSIANSTSSANIDPIQLKTGISTVNTTVVSVGANVLANATSLYIGNSTFTSVFGNGSWTGIANLEITPTSYLIVTGAANVTSNANFANTINVTGASTLANTLGVTGASTLANTLGVTGLTTASGNLNTPTANASSGINVGANVNLTTTKVNIGNSTVNTAITSTAIDTDGTLDVLGAATLANTLSVTGAATLANTLGVTGASTLANTLGVTGLTTASGNLNTPTSNASVAVNVGANVNLTTTKVNIGNSTVNTAITSTAIDTDGTLSVLGTSAFANIVTFKTDYVIDVSANADIGTGTALIYSFDKTIYNSAKFIVQAENGIVFQTSEIILAQNGTSAAVTTYGTVSSNGTASALGTFSANISSTDVRLYLVQTVANSASKVVAHLIK